MHKKLSFEKKKKFPYLDTSCTGFGMLQIDEFNSDKLNMH